MTNQNNAVAVFNATTALANFEAFEKMSKVFAESKAFPSDMNASKFIVLMQAGNDLGLTPTEAIRSLAIINGNVSMFGTKVIERIRQNGYKIQFDEKLDFEIIEKDGQKYQKPKGYCTATLTRGDETRTETYTTEDAMKNGVLGKDVWIKHTKLMLRYRAVGLCVKFFCPEVLGGVGQYEELADHFDVSNPSFETIHTSNETLLEGFASDEPKAIEVEPQVDTITPQRPLATEPTAKVYEIGAQIEHKLFGKGVIEDMFQKTLMVNFDGQIQKITTDTATLI